MPKLNVLEILTHFWPASEPCRQATINDMDFMFPVPALAFPYLATPVNMKARACTSLTTVSLSNLGTISLKSGHFTGQNVLFWRGPIKRSDLQTDNRYRAESFSVDSNLIGQYFSSVTRSDLMRVSHSWTPQLNILEHFKTFLTCIGALQTGKH